MAPKHLKSDITKKVRVDWWDRLRVARAVQTLGLINETPNETLDASHGLKGLEGHSGMW